MFPNNNDADDCYISLQFFSNKKFKRIEYFMSESKNFCKILQTTKSFYCFDATEQIWNAMEQIVQNK